MAQADYNKSSPYYNTPQNSWYLEFWNPPAVIANATTGIFVITDRYKNRPDLLSYDAYGTPKLWWIFAMVNPDTIRDPIYDLVVGLEIKIPTKDSMQGYL